MNTVLQEQDIFLKSVDDGDLKKFPRSSHSQTPPNVNTKLLPQPKFREDT